jgi:hypothetical protein
MAGQATASPIRAARAFRIGDGGVARRGEARRPASPSARRFTPIARA